MAEKLTLTKPDDWHCHLRDNDALSMTVKDSAQQFQRSIVMPNLIPPVTRVESALAYRGRILAHVPSNLTFDPLMTLYLTNETTVEDIAEVAASEHVYALKLYPKGATTNSASGVTDITALAPVFAKMAELGVPLLIHGEVVDEQIDIFEREKIFIDKVLIKLTREFSTLKVVFEHITTKDAVDFVLASPDNIGATITAHHLLYNRNAILAGGIRPHYYCLPVLKHERHRQALIDAATSGNPKFFLGTDSAPHELAKKESSCGCAGIYTAHAAIELYAEAFDAHNALNKLEGFASHFGPDFYGLPRNKETITLEKTPQEIPSYFNYCNTKLVPLKAGETVAWRLC